MTEVNAGEFNAVDDDEQDIDLDLDSDDDQGGDDQDGDQDEGEPVSFGFGEEAEAEEAREPDETPLVRQLRKELRERNRELKRFQVEAPQQAPKRRPRPTIDDHDWDQDKFNADLDLWVEEEKAADKAESEQRRTLEEKNREGTQILNEYQGRAKSFASTHRIPDYEDAQAQVEDELGAEKVSLIIAGSPKAEELIYALYKNPGKMKTLAGIGNLPRFMYEAAMLQKDIKVRQGRKSPPTDKPISSNGSAAMGDKKLAALEAKAAKTGDRTEVVRYKKQLKARAA